MKQETVNKTTRTFWRWLSQELTIRMEQNLPFIRVQPKAICLIGVHSQKDVHLLYQRYPTAKFSVDTPISNGILKKVLAFFHISRPRLQVLSLQGIGLLPVPPFDFLWVSAWQVFFANQVQPFLKQLQGLLREDGLLMMSYLGPDTAKEYRQIFPSEVFLGLDMHDIGDALAKTGFADPVMNMEYLTLTYENSQLLQDDLQALQVIPENLDAAMQKTLYEQLACLKEPGGWSLTLEIVYAHAWLGRKREPNVTTIQASEITVKNKK